MKTPSIRYLCIFIFAASVMLFPDLLSAETDFRIPSIIGSNNNPYMLPDGSGPGFWMSAAIGMVAGLLSSAIGPGGGLLVVPALMTAGISGIYAIGSELFRLFIFSSVESVRMALNKRIHFQLTLYMAIGTALGGYGGFALTRTVFFADPAGSDVFISAMIIIWMLIYSFIIIPDFKDSAADYALELLRKEQEEKLREASVQMEEEQALKEVSTKPEKQGQVKQPQEGSPPEKEEATAAENPQAPQPQEEPKAEFEDDLYPDEKPWEIAKTLRTLKIPPYIKFPTTIKEETEDETLSPALMSRSGKLEESEDQSKPDYEKMPALPALLLSIAGGFFMTLTGSGGIILSFTVLTKGFGCIAALVAGTDLARLAISSGVLNLTTFGVNGFTNIYCITGLIFGTVTGLHLGSKALRHILPYRVKGLVALLVVSVIINRFLALPGLLKQAGAGISSGLTQTLDQSGMYILVIGALIFSCGLIYAFVQGIIQSLQPVKDEEEL